MNNREFETQHQALMDDQHEHPESPYPENALRALEATELADLEGREECRAMAPQSWEFIA